MDLNSLKDRWIAFINRMNRLGIPVPTVRDPKTGKGSITAALVVFSAGLFGLCIIFMLATAVAKWAGAFILTDATLAQIKMAADYSFQFLLAAIGGYLGRYMQKGGDSLPPVDQSSRPDPKTPKVDNPD
jgi:uncharacterized membrane protein YphA (DoxX/SURF4 family)